MPEPLKDLLRSLPDEEAQAILDWLVESGPESVCNQLRKALLQQ